MMTAAPPLPWSTLWLYNDPALCRYRPRDAQDLRLLSVPDAHHESLRSLHATLATRPDSARIHFNGHPCRAQRVTTVEGVHYILRALPLAHSLGDLGVPDAVAAVLLEPCLEGLVLIAGKQGAGKTTLAGALVQARIQRYGGAAQVIEDPPEMAINGVMEYGLIQQIDVHSATAVPSAERLAWHTRNAVRSSTDMLFMGEVRGPLEAAAVVLQAGIGGPIITTIHAESVETAIERLMALAAHEMGPEGAASQISAHLAAVVHLTLSSRPVETSRRHSVPPPPLLVLSTQLLRVRPEDAGLRSAIERHETAQIQQAVYTQNVRRMRQ